MPRNRATRANKLRPRKHPSQKRAVATVDAILEAAACILETHGFDGYNTNAVAARAGASIGSLYQYFPNKTALTRALIARQDADLLHELTQLLQHAPGKGLMDDLIRTAVAHQLKRPLLARLLDVEESRLPPGDDAPRLMAVLTAIFRRSLGDEHIDREPYLVPDLLSIIRGMVDDAGIAGERDSEALVLRVSRAVFGYIDLPPR